MSEPAVTVHAVEEPEEAARLAAARLAELMAGAIERRGQAHVALCGGETPRPAYELLAERIGHPNAVELWFGDERVVPTDDAESNYAMVVEALGAAGLPEGAVHRVEVEREADEAAAHYGELMCERLPLRGELPMLDVAFQGLGPDGHTASLFPGHPALKAEGVCTAVRDSPKPPPERVTLTLPTLRAARAILFLVVGGDKADATARLVAGDSSIPAGLLAGPVTELIADRAALSRSG